eukprot:1981007-Rhodomonas_salina.6
MKNWGSAYKELGTRRFSAIGRSAKAREKGAKSPRQTTLNVIWRNNPFPPIPGRTTRRVSTPRANMIHVGSAVPTHWEHSTSGQYRHSTTLATRTRVGSAVPGMRWEYGRMSPPRRRSMASLQQLSTKYWHPYTLRQLTKSWYVSWYHVLVRHTTPSTVRQTAQGTGASDDTKRPGTQVYLRQHHALCQPIKPPTLRQTMRRAGPNMQSRQRTLPPSVYTMQRHMRNAKHVAWAQELTSHSPATATSTMVCPRHSRIGHSLDRAGVCLSVSSARAVRGQTRRRWKR